MKINQLKQGGHEMENLMQNRWVKWGINIVIILVVLFLLTLILKGIGGWFHIGAGVGSTGFNFNLGASGQ